MSVRSWELFQSQLGVAELPPSWSRRAPSDPAYVEPPSFLSPGLFSHRTPSVSGRSPSSLCLSLKPPSSLHVSLEPPRFLRPILDFPISLNSFLWILQSRASDNLRLNHSPHFRSLDPPSSLHPNLEPPSSHHPSLEPPSFLHLSLKATKLPQSQPVTGSGHLPPSQR